MHRSGIIIGLMGKENGRTTNRSLTVGEVDQVGSCKHNWIMESADRRAETRPRATLSGECKKCHITKRFRTGIRRPNDPNDTESFWIRRAMANRRVLDAFAPNEID